MEDYLEDKDTPEVRAWGNVRILVLSGDTSPAEMLGLLEAADQHGTIHEIIVEDDTRGLIRQGIRVDSGLVPAILKDVLIGPPKMEPPPYIERMERERPFKTRAEWRRAMKGGKR
jgi:hypothetical protein